MDEEINQKRIVLHKISILKNDINIMKNMMNDMRVEMNEMKKIMMEYLSKPDINVKENKENNYWFYK
jgi:hypothetical protein|tara:strand:- start:66 stop:266 length:201 start_codon:yes stop_codon:yes gene_type:complete